MRLEHPERAGRVRLDIELSNPVNTLTRQARLRESIPPLLVLMIMGASSGTAQSRFGRTVLRSICIYGVLNE